MIAGKIKFVSNTSHAEMEIDFPYTETGMLNMKHYQVLATDYNYALVWKCQRTIFGHRRAAQVMSRSPKALEQKTLLELRAMLKHLELDDSVRLNEIGQSNCDQPLTTVKPSRTKPSKDRTPIPDESEKPVSGRPNNSGGGKDNNKNKKKLISIDVGGFHLSIHFPFW